MKAKRTEYKLGSRCEDTKDFHVDAVDTIDALLQHPNIKDTNRPYCQYSIEDTIISGMIVWDAVNCPIGLSWNDADDYCIQYDY